MQQRDYAFDSYAQQSPYRDTPNNSRPPGQSSVQAAVAGQGAPAPPAAPAPSTTTPGAPNYPVDPGMSQWRTGGYAAPAYNTFSSGNAMSGWDQTKWNDPNKQSPKYAVGHILSNYNPQGSVGNGQLNAAVADIQRAYPGTTHDGKGNVTIPGVGRVDILEAAGNGGKAWQWGAEDNGSPNGQPTTATGRISPLQVAITQQAPTDDYAKTLLDSLMRNY